MTAPEAALSAVPGLPLDAAVDRPPRWIKVIDQTRCIGCHACTTACKSENEVPLGVTRTYVKAVDVGVFPQARRVFQVTRCNQCTDAPCVAACPTAAMFRRPDGIVDFDKSACIGCKACIAACPYDAIFINPEDHSAEKCNLCAHRIDVGLEPACVVVCPTQAILVGDLHDPSSRVAAIVERDSVAVRRPEKETRPGLFYRGAHEAVIDPLAARRPAGSTFMWSERPVGGHIVEGGHPSSGVLGVPTSSAAAVLAYDVPHRMPWDWRVSLYTWTKAIAAGAYLVPLLLVLAGVVPDTSPLWTWSAPVLGGSFLGLTALLLIADLEHPARFLKIFLRPQWRSWLVRGAVLLSGFGAVLFIHFVSSAVVATGATDAPGVAAAASAVAWAGAPLAVGTAVYTAYLFAQARARDLWQDPLLPIELLVSALLAGIAASLLAATLVEPSATSTLARWLAVTAGAQVVLVAAAITLGHPTAHARLAAREMILGRYAGFFWAGIVLTALGLLASVAEPIAPLLAAAVLAGLLAHEHAYVQAGQSVPLA
jgi:Fe-S-cluster-containing dehydrogenase component/formate-dependent nitrite reductase membrane component NrfD